MICNVYTISRYTQAIHTKRYNFDGPTCKTKLQLSDYNVSQDSDKSENIHLGLTSWPKDIGPHFIWSMMWLTTVPSSPAWLPVKVMTQPPRSTNTLIRSLMTTCLLSLSLRRVTGTLHLVGILLCQHTACYCSLIRREREGQRERDSCKQQAKAMGLGKLIKYYC